MFSLYLLQCLVYSLFVSLVRKMHNYFSSFSECETFNKYEKKKFKCSKPGKRYRKKCLELSIT